MGAVLQKVYQLPLWNKTNQSKPKHSDVCCVLVSVVQIFSITLIFKRKLNALGWHLLIPLHRFQVYKPMTHDLYIALCAHHLRSSLLSPYTQPPLPFATPTSLFTRNHHTVVCVYEFFICLLFSTQLWPRSLLSHTSWNAVFWHACTDYNIWAKLQLSSEGLFKCPLVPR